MSIDPLAAAAPAQQLLHNRLASQAGSSGFVARQVSELALDNAVQAPQEASDHVDPKALQDRVDGLNAAMKQRSSSIEFSIDDDSGRTIVKVVDTESQAVLMQYPSKELLAISKEIDQFEGLFVRTKA